MKTKVKSRIKAKYLNSIFSTFSIISISIIILNSFNIIPFSFSNINNTSTVSALSYSNNTNLQFTLEPSITISVSGDLIINNLSPGSSSDSNIIDVNVITNNSTGYSLSATVGNESSPTTDLVHSDSNSSSNNSSNNSSSNNSSSDNGNSNSNSNNTFASLTTDTSSLSDFNDNTWGYSYSIDTNSSNNSNTTWSNYSGLPLYNNPSVPATVLKDTLNPSSTVSGDTIKFKIGAKASNTQVSGTYTNVVNFYAITNPTPFSIPDAFAMNGKTMTPSGYYTMQDMDSTICSTVQVYDEDSQTQLIDVRDNKLYWVAKLRDNHCWMTQNLDLDLEQTPTNVAPLTSLNTDLNEYGANNYDSNNGYACTNTIDPAATTTTTDCSGENEVISWVPERSTIDATGGAADGWTRDSSNPYSVNVGGWYETDEYFVSDKCETSTDARNCDYLTRRGDYANYFSQILYSGNGVHGHLGNYYNQTATIASNDSSWFTTQYDAAQNSICPRNWKIIGGSINNNDFNRLYRFYTGASAAMDKGLYESPFYGVRAGYFYNTTPDYAGVIGYYWTDTVAYVSVINSNFVIPAYSTGKTGGFSIRCLAR